jgi:alpha-L-rhamnosidase
VGLESRGFAVLRLKLRPDTPQQYEDIHVRDITLDGLGSVIAVAPWTQYFDLQGRPPPNSSVRNVTIENVKGSCTTLGSIRGNKGNTIENISIHDIDLKTTGALPELSAVKNLEVKNITINGEPYNAPQNSP